MGSILFYQFVNLFERFSSRILYPNFLLDQIDNASFANYLAFYTMHPRLGAHLIDK